MKKLIILVLLLAVATSISAKTLFTIPLPQDKISVLPDYPNLQIEEIWNATKGIYITGLTTELLIHKCFNIKAGWSLQENIWLASAGIDFTKLDTLGFDFTCGLADAVEKVLKLKIKIDFFVAYPCSLGIGIQIADIRKK